MKKENLFETIGNIDEKFIEEAREKNKSKIRFRKSKWLMTAACLAVVVISVGSILLNSNKLNINSEPKENKCGIVSIKSADVFLNEFSSINHSDNSYVYIEDSKEVDWTKEQVKNYFGKDLTPAYIPKGLKPSSHNNTTTVILDKENNIIFDDTGLEFYDSYYKDGSPKLSENISACYGFSLSASKQGFVKDCADFGKKEVKKTDIAGTKVTFGYCSVEYGPYDKKTHKPTGYYDVYTAEFKYDGIEYQIKTEQLDKNEIIKIVTSIITGEKNITIK